MKKYKALVPYLDKENGLAEVKVGDIVEISEERKAEIEETLRIKVSAEKVFEEIKEKKVKKKDDEATE